VPSWYQEGWRDDDVERASDERRAAADEWDLFNRAVEQTAQDRLRDRGGLGESSLSERGQSLDNGRTQGSGHPRSESDEKEAA
jgi:hypothetical protein